MGRGFAFPRSFRKDTLAESLSRNMRELTTYLNTWVVRFEADGTSLDLPGTLDVTGNTTLDGTLSVAGATDVGSLTEESWSTPTLLNSWVNYGSTLQGARYRKDSNGVVHVQAHLKSGTTTAWTVVFNLPAGYRPANDLMMIGHSDGGLTGGRIAILRVNVKTNGDIEIGPDAYNTLLGFNFSFVAA